MGAFYQNYLSSILPVTPHNLPYPSCPSCSSIDVPAQQGEHRRGGWVQRPVAATREGEGSEALPKLPGRHEELV